MVAGQSFPVSVIHRIALYSDGTVGYAKGEMNATRTQDWFLYRKDQAARQTVGRWQQDDVNVPFTLGSGSGHAVCDQNAQTMRVIAMAQINEGADLACERE